MADGKSELPRFGAAYSIAIAALAIVVLVILTVNFYPPPAFRGKASFPWYVALVVLYGLGGGLVELACDPGSRARMPAPLRRSWPWAVFAAVFWTGYAVFYVALYAKFA